LVALIAGTLFAVRHFGSQPLSELLRWISGLGASAPLVFIPLYVLAYVLFIPGSILTLSAGFLFGVIRGSIYVSVAATLGATLVFLIGRYFARQWVAARPANYPKFKAVDEAVAQKGWKIVALTMLLSLLSFRLTIGFKKMELVSKNGSTVPTAVERRNRLPAVGIRTTQLQLGGTEKRRFQRRGRRARLPPARIGDKTFVVIGFL
jgi:hypothetical protein